MTTPQFETGSESARVMLRRVCDGLSGAGDIERCVQPVPPATLPGAFQSLLVHNNHMTTTLKEFYATPVELRVLTQRLDGDHYCREILLVLRDTDCVVEYGVMNFHLGYASEEVRRVVLERKMPLGDVLIQHNVLRRIEPACFLTVEKDSEITRRFGMPEPTEAFGRLGTIYYDEKPAIELLEVVVDRRSECDVLRGDAIAVTKQRPS